MSPTKSKLLLSAAIGNLDCTEQERADIREHIRDADITWVNDEHHARKIAESYLQMIRDANTEDAAEPKWEQIHHAVVGCKASCCTALARWNIWVEVVPGIMFSVQACSKHAGKEESEQ